MFTIVIPVLNQHQVTESMFQTWVEHAMGKLDVLFIDNGSDQPLGDQKFIKEWSKWHNVKCIRNDTNVGVYPTFQQGFNNTDSTFIFFSHNDVEMVHYGWDNELTSILKVLLYSNQKPGVCGMFGAKGIGTPDIYRSPYNFTQMMRWDCVTVNSMFDGKSARLLDSQYEKVAVLDGFSLIVSRKMINSLRGKFDYERYPVHHMYDHDICLESIFAGYSNFVIDIDCKHHGGVTSTREPWAEKMGTTDYSVHREAHKVFYEKYRGKLPFGVK